MKNSLLSVKDLKKHFPVEEGRLFRSRKRVVHAVDGISFDLGRNEVLSLVGESGSGKSTTGRLILRLLEPTEGEITFMGEDISNAGKKRMKELRRHMQIIFQDPYASLNPRMTVGEIVEEPLIVHRIGTKQERRDEVARLLHKVGLNPEVMRRYPHEFSGGQRQRIGIARSIALKPGLIVADEPVSALDVSIQSQVINLLKELQEENQISYLFIAHDLNIVRIISDRIAVMYLGKIVEHAETEELFKRPLHPYTQALLSAIPVPDPSKKERKVILLEGDIPSPIDIPEGCRFHTRCPKMIPRCKEIIPSLDNYGNSHTAACIRAGEWA
ncbi:MAG: ATP-binding cassette domain-containing protein [Nitrospirae bacterium]|nr:ATP-binding cassette domain-containing protein [Nitrospirota bacterium]